MGGMWCRMAYEISPVEHGQILADIKHLKDDAKQLNERVDDLEKKAWQNDVDHESYKKIAEHVGQIEYSIKKLENSTVIVTEKQAKENGVPMVVQFLKNPQYMMYLIIGILVIVMIIQGRSYQEISEVVKNLK